MPQFREGDRPPAWCELELFALVAAIPGEVVDMRRRAAKERLLITSGSLQVAFGGASVVLRDGQFVDVPPVDTFEARIGARPASFARLSGRWGEELGGCGLFGVASDPHWTNSGDPVAYAKSTSVDSHYHDCDEYWIVLEGEGTVVVGDRQMRVAPGDCVPIGMGHHHDLPAVVSPIKALYFETTLEREKRVGHLWNHTHGPAVPRPERV